MNPLTACNDTLTALQAEFAACGCPSNATAVDPCAYVAPNNYDYGLHVGAVFIIMVCSTIGAVLPIVSASCGGSAMGYSIALGKHVGTGIVLACGLIHMLQPAAASLTDPCVPYEFNTDYPAYAFLYAMLSAILMHFVETAAIEYVADRYPEDNASVAADNETAANKQMNDDASSAHSLVDRHLVQSYTIELALTVHSVFIGLAVGTVGYDDLVALLTALCFHQGFEGVALGARLADAPLSRLQTALFVLVFVLSAPVGIACGIVYSATVNPSGITYLLVEGTFDGLCAGLLLYVGFQLLFFDFREDVKKYCRSSPRKNWMRAGLFVALWTGAGFMAYIGKYL